MTRWYASGIRFGCTQGGDCCHNHGDYDSVYVTRGEATEMARVLHVSVQELMASYLQIEDGYLVTRTRAGACVFLEGCRCAIYSARPTPCRTWPFWPDTLKRSTWDREVTPFCRGVGQGPLHDRRAIEIAAKEKDAHDRAVEAECGSHGSLGLAVDEVVRS